MKRYTVAPSTLIEVEEGYIVLHSDYAILESKFKIACAQNKALLEQRNSILARHNALVEAEAWERECEELHGIITELYCNVAESAPEEDEISMTYFAARAEVDRLLQEEK